MEVDPIYHAVTDSVSDAFSTMLMVDVEFVEAETFAGSYDQSRVIATIGLGCEGLEANLNLVLDTRCASFVVSLMLGEENVSDEATLRDGIGEIANLVAGGIKRRLTELDLNFAISLPSVILTEHSVVSTKSATALYPIQFVVESEYMVEGVFLIREATDEPTSKAPLERATGE